MFVYGRKFVVFLRVYYYCKGYVSIVGFVMVFIMVGSFCDFIVYDFINIFLCFLVESI